MAAIYRVQRLTEAVYGLMASDGGAPPPPPPPPAPAEPEPGPVAFYWTVRKGKPRRRITPRQDLERAAERAFARPDPVKSTAPTASVPSAEIDLPDIAMPPRSDELDRGLAELAAVLEAKSKRVQRKIVKAAYDDDEELLALL